MESEPPGSCVRLSQPSVIQLLCLVQVNRAQIVLDLSMSVVGRQQPAARSVPASGSRVLTTLSSRRAEKPSC